MPEPSAPTALSPGLSRVDQAGRRYELVRELGSGGFGTVWLARMHNPGGLSQAVALKILRERPDARSQALERLMDEALVLSNLRHPVIVAAFDLARFDREVALVTEYVEGRDLGECLAQDARMPAGAVLEVVGQVASALDDAWTRLQIVHRDVKPANIRIGRHGTVKLLDFGIARSALPRSAETGTNLVVGSLPYLAPERYKHRDPHPASDVYALGCVLYEGLTGARLVDGLETAEIIGLGHDRDELEALVERRLADPPAPTPETTSTVLVRAPFPVTVRELLREMLAFDPTQRPPASEVARRAERAQDALPDRVGLRTYCRSLTWPDDGVPTGPSPVSPDVTTAPSPPAAGPPVRSPSSAPETLALTTSGVTDRAPPVRTRWLGLGAALGTVGLAGSGGIALVLLLAAAVMLALSEPWWSAQEPTPALRPAAPRRDAPAPPPVPVDPPAPAPNGPAPLTPHAPPAAAPPPDAPPVEVPPVDPPPESPAPPSAPDPAPAAPVAGSVTLRLSDPGPYTSVTVNCKDGTRGRAALSQGVAVVGGLPPAGASCTAFFVGGATQPSVPVVVGADLTCQRGVKLTCWGSPPR